MAIAARGQGAVAVGPAAVASGRLPLAAALQQTEEPRHAGWQLAFAVLLGLGGTAASSRAEAAEQAPPDKDKVWLGGCKDLVRCCGKLMLPLFTSCTLF